MELDIHQLFREDLPNQYSKDPETVKRIGGKFQINITGAGGGEWFVDASSSGPQVLLGNPGDADATITLTAEDFQKLYENPRANTVHLMLANKIYMTGDQLLARKVHALFLVGR